MRQEVEDRWYSTMSKLDSLTRPVQVIWLEVLTAELG